MFQILETIESWINQIPRDIALQIKRLFGFILFILFIVAIYVGYKLGIKASKIPGEPLIRNTNEVFMLKKSNQKGSMNLKLAPEDEMLLDLSEKRYLQKEKIRQRVDQGHGFDAKKENSYLGLDKIRGIKPGFQDNKEIELRTKFLEPEPMELKRNTRSRMRGPIEADMKKARSPKPLEPDLLGVKGIGKKTSKMWLEEKEKNKSLTEKRMGKSDKKKEEKLGGPLTIKKSQKDLLKELKNRRKRRAQKVRIHQKTEEIKLSPIYE